MPLNRRISRFFIVFTVLTGLFCFSASSQRMHTTEVEVQKGEKWWGLYVSGSPAQPFEAPFELTTMHSRGGSYTTSVLLSNTGRYVYCDEPFTVVFDGGERFTLTSDSEPVVVKKGGKNLREAYLVCCHNHFEPDHTIPPVEMFTMPHYETGYDPGAFSSQDEITEYARRLLSEGFPPGVLVLAEGWDQPNKLYDFSHSLFPDPKGMVEALHGLGFKVMLTVSPYCSPYGRYYLDGVERGDFITGRDGKPLMVHVNGGVAACRDFTKPSMAEAARSNLRLLSQQYGIDGFRFDCTGMLAAMGENSPAAIGFLTSWMSLAPADGLNEFLPSVSGRFAPYVTGIAHSGEGDVISSAVTTLVSAGLTGYPYSTIVNLFNDGGVLPASGEVLAEYLLLEVVMPVPRVRFAPWRITDPKLYAAVRDAVNFRAEIAPYMAELVDESAKMAVPLLRHPEYVFPRSGFADCSDQFMLGNRYLFAPARAGEGRRMVRLPKGNWIDREGRRFKGPVVTEVDCSDRKLHCFILNTK